MDDAQQTSHLDSYGKDPKMSNRFFIAGDSGFRAILDRFPDGTALAEGISEDPSMILDWWQQDDIPSRFWAKLSWYALQSGIRGVTFITLAHIAVGQKSAKAEARRAGLPCA
jgi:hypothetical protein